MPWEARGRRHYYYRTRRVNGKVVRTYLGAGEEAQRAAEEDARKQARRKLARKLKRDLIEVDRIVRRRLFLSHMLEQILLEDEGLRRRWWQNMSSRWSGSRCLSPEAQIRLRARLAAALRVPDRPPPRAVEVHRWRPARDAHAAGPLRNRKRHALWISARRMMPGRNVESRTGPSRLPERREPVTQRFSTVRPRARGPPQQISMTITGFPPHHGGSQAAAGVRASVEKACSFRAAAGSVRGTAPQGSPKRFVLRLAFSASRGVTPA